MIVLGAYVALVALGAHASGIHCPMIPRYSALVLEYCNKPPGCRGVIATYQLIYEDIQLISEAPPVRS